MKNNHTKRCGKRLAATTLTGLTALLLLINTSLLAQLKGTHLVGDMGLQSGSQPPPSLTTFVPVYNYHTATLINAAGDKISAPSINMFLVGLGGGIVTNAKVLGGTYGASVMLAFAKSRIEGNLISTESSLAFTDMYVQPLQLGWKTKKADFTFGYALYLPTGKYALGGDDNAGLGILSNELSAGSTVFLDPKKEWNFSALFSYAFNGKKKNTGANEITVGNPLTIEGGLGKTWYKPVKGSPLPMIINAGMVYYLQYKTTADKMKIPTISNSAFDLSNKDRIYALGAEANAFFPTIKGSVSLRWLGELGARNRTQGNSFFITLAPYVKFLASKKAE